MHRKNLMLSSTAALALAVAAFAAPAAMAQAIPPATSYADLFAPVPDAAAKLDAADTMERAQGVHMEKAQYWSDYGPPRYYHHHHHHHHSPGWYMDRGFYWDGWRWVPRPMYYHHHHHHHHHHYWGW